MEWHEREALRQLAEEQNWEFGDYDVESQVLDAKFRHWVPRFAAYSVIILLDSIVEAQLFAYAERIGRVRGSAFRPQQILDKAGRRWVGVVHDRPDTCRARVLPTSL